MTAGHGRIAVEIDRDGGEVTIAVRARRWTRSERSGRRRRRAYTLTLTVPGALAVSAALTAAGVSESQDVTIRAEVMGRILEDGATWHDESP